MILALILMLQLSYQDKCAQSGVLGCWPFDDVSELRYAWDGSNAALNEALKGQKRFTISRQRIPGEGNTLARQHISGALSVPVIDNGALRFTIPSESSADPGFFQDNFNKVLGNPSLYINPESPNGSEFWMQFRLRVNDVMLDETFRDAPFLFNLSTPSAGSLNVTATYAAFTPEMVGEKLIISPGGNFVAGFYAIVERLTDRNIVLDRSPTPIAAGITALAQVSSKRNAGGAKVVILFGNPPNGSSSSPTEITMNDGGQRNFPTMYGQQGTDAPSPQMSVPFPRNRFAEYTIAVQMAGASNERTNRVRWWVDGVLAGDWPTARAAWAAGYGFGQFMLTPYHTRKDPTQGHETGYVWYDDVIVSTKPIQMVGHEPPIPPDPCVVDPLVLSSLGLPTAPTGSRALRWDSGAREIVSGAWEWVAGKLTVRFEDSRGCLFEVSR